MAKTILWRLLRWSAAAFCTLSALALIVGFVLLRQARSNLPPLPDLQELRPHYPTGVRAQNGAHLGGSPTLEPVDYDDLPPLLIACVLAAEDEDFFAHRGFKIRSILRAALANHRAGRSVQGASTITQQVAKSFLSQERTLSRKIQELLLALELERHYSKEQILAAYLQSAYLQSAYLGQRAYGVTMASYRYFNRPPSRLTTGQMALLAGILPAPSLFNPLDNPERAQIQRDRVLSRLLAMGILSDDEFERLKAQPITDLLDTARDPSPAPEAMGTVLRDWETIGRSRPLDQSDLEIITTHSPAHQSLARQALQTGIEAHDRRTGYRGPPAHALDIDALITALDDADDLKTSPLFPALITSIDDEGLHLHTPRGEEFLHHSALAWIHGLHPRTQKPRQPPKPWYEQFSPGDLVFARHDGEELQLWQHPEMEGAFIIADHRSTEILASVGAYDPSTSRFNRAEQACRQPGSLFKTVLYAEALSQGITLATLLRDIPTDVASSTGVWQPRNADHDFRGYLTALDAFALSRNLPAVNLLEHTGVQPVISRARKMGITSILDPVPALALGASCTLPVEMLRVHSAVARQGRAFNEQPLAFIRDHRSGQILDFGHFLQRDPALLPRIVRATAAPVTSPKAIQNTESFLLQQALRDAATRGTARALDPNAPLFAKTGTSSDFDAWLATFDPQITAVVWVGSDQNDQNFQPGEHGATVALPIFAHYYQGFVAPEPAPEPPSPPEIEFITIDPQTGLRSRPNEPGRDYPFVRGTAPRELAPSRATRQLERFESLLY